MKKLLNVLSIFALLATMTLGVASCQQKNQPETPQTEDEPTLVGDWSCTTITHYEMEGGTEVVVQTVNVIDESTLFLSLEKDGTGIMKAEGDSVSFKWKKVGNQLMLYVENELLTTYEIKSLTKQQLILTTYMNEARTARVEQTFVKK